ncbi:hypothetical protein [Duganella vulcania]|uniref:Uncharacterized protein n=1 Tax=Duganella vulcania TaxID=2692166 RepID=A0A845GG22_9BURK|nr:hypothetical protein [Duganella vulcania]MYM93244.1 hypothetical protein [Duganella vulcania]
MPLAVALKNFADAFAAGSQSLGRREYRAPQPFTEPIPIGLVPNVPKGQRVDDPQAKEKVIALADAMDAQFKTWGEKDKARKPVNDVSRIVGVN